LIGVVRDLGQRVEETPVDSQSRVLAAVRLEPGSGRLSGAVPAVLGGFAAGY
jgi:hypothetical protein